MSAFVRLFSAFKSNIVENFTNAFIKSISKHGKIMERQADPSHELIKRFHSAAYKQDTNDLVSQINTLESISLNNLAPTKPLCNNIDKKVNTNFKTCRANITFNGFRNYLGDGSTKFLKSFYFPKSEIDLKTKMIFKPIDISYLTKSTELVTLNVVAIADYTTYCHFFNQSFFKNHDKAIANLKSYLSDVFKNLNDLYATIDSGNFRYKIKMSELIVLDDPQNADCQQLMFRNEEDFLRHYDFYIMKMGQLLKGKYYDAALGFTLTRVASNALGEARFDSIGGFDPHGVVQLRNIDMTSYTAAHELGHILGANHDDADGQYNIMRSRLSKLHMSEAKFSDRSIEEIANSIRRLKHTGINYYSWLGY